MSVYGGRRRRGRHLLPRGRHVVEDTGDADQEEEEHEDEVEHQEGVEHHELHSASTPGPFSPAPSPLPSLPIKQTPPSDILLHS